MRAIVQAVSVNRVTPRISSSHSSQAASPPACFQLGDVFYFHCLFWHFVVFFFCFLGFLKLVNAIGLLVQREKKKKQKQKNDLCTCGFLGVYKYVRGCVAHTRWLFSLFSDLSRLSRE